MASLTEEPTQFYQYIQFLLLLELRASPTQGTRHSTERVVYIGNSQNGSYLTAFPNFDPTSRGLWRKAQHSLTISCPLTVHFAFLSQISLEWNTSGWAKPFNTSTYLSLWQIFPLVVIICSALTISSCSPPPDICSLPALRLALLELLLMIEKHVFGSETS
jgi:hypothetical protein